MIDRGKLRVVIPLGVSQTIAWASSYYLPAILARPIAADLGMSETWIFGALTGALLIAGLLGPCVGQLIDRIGGRGLLSASNLILATGLIILGLAGNLFWIGVAWLCLGVGMGTGLYEPAFATLTRLYGSDARSAITGITLLAGLASTVGWPLTALLEAQFDWRTACFCWAGLHILLALPLNLSLPHPTQPPFFAKTVDDIGEHDKAAETKAMIVIAYVFAATGFVSVGLSAQLPNLMLELGAAPAAALLAASMVGPAQVFARIIEASLLKRLHPVASTRLAATMHPIGTLLVALGGPVLAPAFAIFYGAGNGVLTIARGTLPLAVFGPVGFGRRVGVISVPARIGSAFAPLILGVAMQSMGAQVLWITCALSLSAAAALFLLRSRTA